MDRLQLEELRRLAGITERHDEFRVNEAEFDPSTGSSIDPEAELVMVLREMPHTLKNILRYVKAKDSKKGYPALGRAISEMSVVLRAFGFTFEADQLRKVAAKVRKTHGSWW